MAVTLNANTSTGFIATSDTSGVLQLQTGGTTAVTVDASQQVGIGTVSPANPLDVVGAVPARFTASSAAVSSYYGGVIVARTTKTASDGTGIGFNLNNASDTSVEYGYIGTLIETNTAGSQNGAIVFAPAVGNSRTERMRIDSSGNLLVGTTGTVNPGGVGGTSSFKTATANKWAGAFENSSASSPWGVGVTFTGVAPNGTSNAFFYCTDVGGDRFYMRSNGGLANFSANNVNISDRREKTNFAPAGDYLTKICAIPVQTFNYIDQNMEEDDGLTLGVVAQDVQTVAPELVMESDWSSKKDGSKMRLSIYQTDLQYALMKCIQEQQAIITSLTDRITALEGTTP